MKKFQIIAWLMWNKEVVVNRLNKMKTSIYDDVGFLFKF
jgi:hypothetical protein